jgi:His/Glu/Gln/Arg/opine family amino acid ABC transporter permease subunit
MQWGLIWSYRDVLWRGLALTLELSAVSIAGSFVVGVAVGCLGATGGFLLPRLVRLYTELLRNLPLVVKLFFLYFVLGMDAIAAGLIALITHQSAYIADLVTAGFRAVPREQAEGAWASGLTGLQVFRHVLMPQVLRVVLPPLTSQFIEVVKNSATVMLIGVQELTFETQRIETETFRGFEAASTATVLYLLVSLAIVLLMHRAGRLVR